MKIKKNTRIIIWLAFLVTGIVLLIMPKNLVSSNEFSLDKIAHFGLYFLLSYFAFRTFRAKNSRYKIVLLMLMLAIGLEYLQIYIPHREFSYHDMVMNVLGLFGGIFLYKLMK